MFFAVSFATAVGLAVGPWISLTAGLLSAALVAGGLLWFGGLRIAVDEQGLQAGRFRLEPQYLGDVVAHDADRTRRRLGPEADRRALLVVRGYVATSVEVGVADPADPHPYWLVSSRRPEALAAALAEVKDRIPR